LGGARAINRRYISDHVPVKQLTSASAAFVSASALGMAVGPALAGVLSKLDFKVRNQEARIEPHFVLSFLSGSYGEFLSSIFFPFWPKQAMSFTDSNDVNFCPI